MRREDSRVHLSAEEEIAADESLSIYCKPVELYNILQRSASGNAILKMTVSVPGMVNERVLTQSHFPLCILLARLVYDVVAAEYSAVYCFLRACILTSFTGFEGGNQAQASFLLPEINKLAMEAKSGSLAILLVSSVEKLVGKRNICTTVSTEYSGWQKCTQLNCLIEDECIFIQSSSNSLSVNQSRQLQVIISAEEVGAKEKSPYNSYICGGVSSSSLSHIIRLRAGNVIFNYRYYYNNLQRTEESNLQAGGCDLLDNAHGTAGQNARVGTIEHAQHLPFSFKVAGVAGAAGQSYYDSERVQSVSGNNLAPSALL
ncbi:hypothetical protein PTKIN_Ptkin04bG0011600 [Pterospermum kingtungense]